LTEGVHDVEILPTGVATPAITATLAVSASKDYMAIAIGGANGHELALAALQVTADPAFLKRVNELAERLQSGFQQLQQRYPETLTAIRQLGLMIGLVFPDELCGPLMTKFLFDEGVLAIYANNDQRVLQFLPPLTMDDIEAEEALGALDRALCALSTARGWAMAH
jgi:acetylornithine/succinyldiaminopimelate/putrescine aminotransferase